MLRINLLPAYIAERRQVRTAIVLAALLFIIVTCLGLGYDFLILSPQVAKMQADATAEQAEADKETAYVAATAAIRAQIAPLQDKVNFVEQVQFQNKIRQKIFRNAAKFTYRKVEYDSMAVSGSTLSIGATVSSLSDIGRFYILMFGNPDVTAVSISGVPGWADVEKQQPVIIPGGPPPTPPAYRLAMNATLVKAVTAPTLPASLGPPGAAGGDINGPGGMPGGPGGPAGGP